jgi:hypothetical protein
MRYETAQQEVKRLRELEKKVETLLNAREEHSALSGPFINAVCALHRFWYESKGLKYPMKTGVSSATNQLKK